MTTLLAKSSSAVATEPPALDPAAPEVAATDIAVIGRALRVPGADSVAEYWDNLRQGVESIRRLSDDELRAAGVPAAVLADPNYVKVGAPLRNMEQFDAGFFGFNPREAAIMDPQHRHFLEVAWEALEDAGHVPELFPGRIGVFAGSGMNAYMPYHLFTNPKLMASSGLFLVRHTGNDKDFLTTRVSYLFDLRGPSVNIQTACSTSLVAIHAASQSLINQECDMALAGGVTIEMPHGHGYLYQEGEILSDDGHCRAFDGRAKGTVFGSGAGLVVLRRLADALADGDAIYAVIKGSAVNNDGGRKVGYLAPSVDGQAEAIAEALNMSGVPAETISYIECHGTGTPVGDPIEVTALTNAFRSVTDRKRFCAIGSAKTNIGHLDTAAGVAGFIKVVEMLRHRTLVPNLHFREPNPEVDWANSPFFVSDRTAPWQGDGVLRAAVNSLGVGGTNAHVVLQEAPALAPPEEAASGTLLVLSARSKASLTRAAQRLADHLERHPEIDLSDAAFTLATGRRRFAERRAIAATSREEAIAALRAEDTRRPMPKSVSGRQVAFLFPGGGAQYPGMARDLYEIEPAFRAIVDRCLDLLRVHERLDLRPLMFPAPGTEEAAAAELLRPSLALPALLTIELAVAELLRTWGITPVAMLGHSMGEYAAAYLAGVFSLRDVLAVVACRGRLFETLPEGAMLSVPLPESEVTADLLPGLSFAAVNGPGLCLVSGEVQAIASLQSTLAARGVDAKRLAITVAAHSQMLDPILGEFERYLRTLRLSEPTMPFVSNVTGTWIRPEEARDPAYWVRHLRQPVRFSDGLSALVGMGDLVLLEVGPGRTLTSLAQGHPEVGAARVSQSLRHPQDPTSDQQALLGAVGRLWVAGVEPDWTAFLGEGRCRVSLPTYSFDHERHWIEPGDGFFMRTPEAQGLEKKADRSQWTYRRTWRTSSAPAAAPSAPRTITVFADQAGVGRELALELQAAGHAVDIVVPGAAFAAGSDGTFRVRPDSREDHAALLRELSARGRTPSQILHLWAVDSGAAGGPSAAADRYFFPFVALAQALVDEEPSGPVELVVVTSGAEALAGDAAAAFPEKALCEGPVRVVPRELPSVACRSIDLPAAFASVSATARLLAREVDLLSTDARVALRGGERFVEGYERFPLADAAGSWPLRQRGVVLVTGGLGGIALAMAERLARTAQARFVLVGRSTVPDRDEWPRLLAALDPRHPLATRIRGIQAVEAAGGEVLVVAADVADPAQVANAVAAAEARFGSVDAAIHAAGIIDDAPLVSKARDRFESVLRPKVAGAVALVDALQGRALDFVIFFSSTSVALGPAGQADYVSGNAFLNAYARSLTARGVPARAIQWGAWRDVGMAVNALAPSLASVTGETVPHALLQQRVSADAEATTFAAILDARSQWVLDEHRVRGAEAVLPGTAYVEMARAAVAAAGGATDRQAIELVELAFTSPLVVPEKTPAAVETEVRPGADGFAAVTVRSRSGREPATEHASGRGRLLAGWNPGTIDVAAIERRCAVRRESFASGEQRLPQEALLAFGPRWKAVRSLAFGQDEAIARLELTDAHAPDLETFALHPALLDMASGFAFSLLHGSEGQTSLFVPLSYDRVRIAGALPRHLVSHVRRRAESGAGVGVLDVTLAEASGRVVAEIEGYVVKAVDSAVLKGARKPEAPASPLEKWVEHGIGADEGFDLLGRVLRQDGETQMLVSPLDLHLMLAELREPRRAAASAGGTAPAPSSATATAADAPRDEIEVRLAGIWQELLGVDHVRLQDAFFDLGGHSLIAVRLFARMRKAWGIDLPLATLFRAPTLEALAAEVRQHLGLTLEVSDGGAAQPASAPAVQTGWTPLVEIRKGNSARRPFFCVHGAGGNLLNFLDFSKRLDPAQAVFGLEARGVDGQLPPAGSIEEMARIYLEAVRRQQPHGPYVLGGYSGGGVVALEMVRQLAQAGERASQVIMLDTFHPWTQAQEVGWSERLHNLSSSAGAYLRGLFLRHVVWRARDWRLKRHIRNGAAIPHELREWYVATAFIDCNRRHTPSAYDGAVTLFRAASVEKIYEHVGARLGWTEELLPNLQVVEVPGNHDSLVREPNVSILSTGLDEVLARASR